VPGQAAKKPIPGNPTFDQWISALGDADAIPVGDPIFQWADDAKVPREFLHLAWLAFFDKFTGNKSKRHCDWRQYFEDHVKSNWLKIWWCPPEGGCLLTTAGEQWRRVRDSRSVGEAA
jgi:hypothetical protein